MPILTGYTEDEFLTGPQASDMEGLKKEAEEKFGERAGEFLRLIREKGGKNEKSFEEVSAAAQIHSVELGIRRMHQLLVRSGAKQPMYVYSFGPHIPGWTIRAPFILWTCGFSLRRWPSAGDPLPGATMTLPD